MWSLSVLFMEQRILIKWGLGVAVAAVLTTWGLFSIYYTWTWRMDILDTFMSTESVINVNSLKDILEHNAKNKDVQLKLVTYLDSGILEGLLEAERIPRKDIITLMSTTEFVPGNNGLCIFKTIDRYSSGEYGICIGTMLDFTVAPLVVKFAGIEKYDLLRIKGLDQIPRYVSLAFEIDFPYIRVANERISALIATGQVENMFHKILNLPGPMYSKKQRLAQQFDTSVSLEVIEVILQTLAWCIGIAVGVFAVETALHYKELVAGFARLKKRICGILK
jgi:hypothetical protein